MYISSIIYFIFNFVIIAFYLWSDKKRISLFKFHLTYNAELIIIIRHNIGAQTLPALSVIACGNLTKNIGSRDRNVSTYNENVSRVDFIDDTWTTVCVSIFLTSFALPVIHQRCVMYHKKLRTFRSSSYICWYRQPSAPVYGFAARWKTRPWNPDSAYIRQENLFGKYRISSSIIYQLHL